MGGRSFNDLERLVDSLEERIHRIERGQATFVSWTYWLRLDRNGFTTVTPTSDPTHVMIRYSDGTVLIRECA
jgi:hypothetical protein